ncbi:PAS domain-containing sensor histidine kinase [Bacteroides sp. 214]|uniref:PAS domain-containing sensor histidine kinase n=1 Tax=Bacteroides sp. 214 TaxID=2302935 RepID=UPI0013D32860|nr:PAS domain-containing protein [Bacteroides sp. 214]NDW13000.1 PAS domain-containing sensor histidine kinase [Bacteroides sp. 214]
MNCEESTTSNERVDLLLDIAGLGWWEADFGRETFVYAESTATMLGLDKEGCTFDTFNKIIREDYRVKIINELISLKPGTTRTITYPVTTIHGELWVEGKCRVKETHNNKPLIIIGTLQRVENPEETKQQENSYLQDLYKYMPIGYQQTRLIYENGIPVDYEFLEINKRIEIISGKTRDWILSSRGSEQEDSFESELNHMIEVVNTDKHLEYDYLEESLDNRCRAIMFSPQKDIIVTLLLDVTETYNANKALRESEQLLRDIYTNLPVGLEIFDANGILIEANEKDVDILGMACKDDYMGVNIFNHPILPLEVKERMKRGERMDFNSSYEYSRVLDGYYKRLPVKKGTSSVITKIVPVINAKGDIQNYIFINIDNTETTNAYLRIQEFEEYFSLIADYAKVGYFKWNLMKQEGFAISQWYKNLGMDANTLIGANLDDEYKTLTLEDARVLKKFYQDAREGNAKILNREVKVSKEGEAPRWLRCTLMVKEYDPENNNIEMIGLSVDITELKEMILAKDKAEALDKLKSAFLANMSHEIRTPLNAIVGFSDAVCEVEDVEERRELAAIIRHNNNLLLKLVSDVLDLSKLEANMFELNKREFSLKSFSDDIVTSMQNKIPENVKLQLSEELPEVDIDGDQERIQQVVVNLLSNAFKFTKQGSVTFGYELTNSDTILFYVNDTGIGIPQEEQERIFERFVKLDSFVQGTGLGLSVSKNMVIQMGGEMGVVSEPGMGSRFWFTLPVRG